mmetsp:Transcript_19377/g.34024  ORF Transcript_19377/g.34024 Transcript_19377/m.34024 type:complete len:483 (+) Transcript_19377:86-1534(+)
MKFLSSTLATLLSLSVVIPQRQLQGVHAQRIPRPTRSPVLSPQINNDTIESVQRYSPQIKDDEVKNVFGITYVDVLENDIRAPGGGKLMVAAILDNNARKLGKLSDGGKLSDSKLNDGSRRKLGEEGKKLNKKERKKLEKLEKEAEEEKNNQGDNIEDDKATIAAIADRPLETSILGNPVDQIEIPFETEKEDDDSIAEVQPGGQPSRAGGRCDITGNRQRVRYTPPDNGFEGTDRCTYEACDQRGGCGTAEIRLRVVGTVDLTEKPMEKPTEKPTKTPTKTPTEFPTTSPTVSPTFSPTISPTFSPTFSPTQYPTFFPSISPTYNPKDTIDCPSSKSSKRGGKSGKSGGKSSSSSSSSSSNSKRSRRCDGSKSGKGSKGTSSSSTSSSSSDSTITLIPTYFPTSSTGTPTYNINDDIPEPDSRSSIKINTKEAIKEEMVDNFDSTPATLAGNKPSSIVTVKSSNAKSPAVSKAGKGMRARQ